MVTVVPVRIGNFIYQWYLLFFVFVAGITCSYYLGLSAGRVVGIESALDQGIQPITRMIISSDVVSETQLSVDGASSYKSLTAQHDVSEVSASKEISKKSGDADLSPSVPILRPQKLSPPSHASPAGSVADSEKTGNVIVQTPNAKISGTPVSPEQAFSRILEDREKKVGLPNDGNKKLEIAESAKTFVGTNRLSLDKSSTQSLPKGWFVQVMATSNRRDIEGLAKKLRGSGFPVVVEDTLVDGRAHYRLLVGPEGSRELSERMGDQLKREPGVASRIFIRLVD